VTLELAFEASFAGSFLVASDFLDLASGAGGRFEGFRSALDAAFSTARTWPSFRAFASGRCIGGTPLEPFALSRSASIRIDS
jgi:hypothetical protein